MVIFEMPLLYAAVQLCFGVIAVAAYQKGLVIQLILLLSFSIVFLVSYNLVKMIKPNLSERGGSTGQTAGHFSMSSVK